MRECWLRPNRRILWLSVVVAALVGVGGLLLAWLFPVTGEPAWPGWLGLALAAAGLLADVTFLYHMRLPRLAYEDGHLLVYLRSSTPDRVPIELVECVFLGQGPSLIRASDGRESETANVVIRLAERAAEWRDRETNPSLGEWRCGYVTIRGTWCERITPELVKQLNERLVAAHRRQRGTAPRAERERA
ncbi:MAG: hypothetical protein KY475_03760 [Planctomycetes bacterium]|nr:hypothetical protein [Planctomycetota bacterium]